MKHASAKTLESIAPLLQRVRVIAGLTERKVGTFYLRSSAFLHFHEDPTGLFADAKINLAEFTRFPVNTNDEQNKLMVAIASAVATVSSVTRRPK